MYTPDHPDPAWWAEDAAAAEEAALLYWQWYSACEDRAREEQACWEAAMRVHAPDQIDEGIDLDDLPF